MSDNTSCAFCGKEFIDWSGQMTFCSEKCRSDNYRKEHPEIWINYRQRKKVVRDPFIVKCRNCNAEFKTTTKKKVFCCGKCKIDYHNSIRPVTKFETRICPECGKVFQPLQKTGIGRTYCTSKCSNLARDKRVTPASHGKSWDKTKKFKWNGNWYKVLSRDKFTCQICGLKRWPSGRSWKRKYILEVHHKDGSGEKETKNHILDNLITLCATCHQEFHTKISLVEVDGKYFVRGNIFTILGLKQVDTIET